MLEVSNRLVALVQAEWYRLRSREEGQTMVEYGLLIAGVALIVIAALVILGPKIADLFEETASSVTNPLPGSTP
jgi:pilus assembly protein Flp/PilA